MDRILITGFGPFPGVAHNISGSLAEGIAKHHALFDADCEVRTLVLPTVWHSGPAMLNRTLEMYRPCIVLMLGVSRSAAGFVIETTANNTCDVRLDASGVLPAVGRIGNGAVQLRSEAPITHIAAALRSTGLSSSISDDPGGYLCNAAYYEALQWAALAQPNTMPIVVFIHIPTAFDDADFTIEKAIRGGTAVLRASRSHVSSLA